MKNIALFAAAMLVASPALAYDTNAINYPFTGVRAEANVGVKNFTRDIVRADYGAQLGVDAPVGERFTVGVEANTTDPFWDRREVGAAARVGYIFNPSLLGFVKGGYNNYRINSERHLDGYTIGGGVESIVYKNVYIKGEYKYNDFEQGRNAHAAFVGVGFRIQ